MLEILCKVDIYRSLKRLLGPGRPCQTIETGTENTGTIWCTDYRQQAGR